MKNKLSAYLQILLASVFLAGLNLSALTTHIQLDNRTETIMTGTERVSPTASGTSTGALQVDGTAVSGWTTAAPQWNTTTVTDGWHELSLASPEAATASVLVLNSSAVVIHEGTLASDQVWQAGVVHIVREWVRIPDGTRLIIANGAVVKFCQGTGLQNDGMLSALSATLTALEDDTIGGDTNLDGNESAPAENTYAIKNNGTLTAIACEMRYATADSIFSTTTIAEEAFSGCDEITKVVIPADVTTVGANAFQGCSNLNEVTFQSKNTTVDNTAFDGCDSLNKVNFTSGLPQTPYVFGDATPTIYATGTNLPQTWGGYTVAGGSSPDPSGSGGIPLPEVEGEIGQVLTVTEEGYIWQDIPVDDALDGASENAVQNKVVTAAISALEEADSAMQDDIATLQTEATNLAYTDTAIQGKIADLQAKDTALANADTEMLNSIGALQTRDNELANAQAAINTNLSTIQGNVSSLNGANALIQGDITALKAKDTELTATDNTLAGNITALQTNTAKIETTATNLQKSVTDLQTKDTELTATDNILAGNITALQTNTAKIETTATNLQKSVTDLQTKDTELTATDNTLAGNITALTEKNTAQEQTTNALQTITSSLQTKTTQLTSADTAMRSDISNLGTAIENLMEQPANQGEPGQLLTKTAEGYEWQNFDVAVDDALNANSGNAIQNKVVAQAIGLLEGADTALDGKITALQTNTAKIETTATNLQKSVTALQTKNTELENTVAELQTKLNTLLGLLENDGQEAQVLTKGADSTFGWKNAAAGGAQVLTINLVEGWNLVAIPGNVILDESQASLLAEIEIYTYDKAQQTYVPSQGLLPLNSYWMRAPKACTIHFATAK